MTNPKPPTDPRKPCEICDSTEHTTGYHESGSPQSNNESGVSPQGYHESGVSPQGYHESGVAPEKIKEG